MKHNIQHFQKILKLYYPQNYLTLWGMVEVEVKKIETDVAFAATSANPMDRRLAIVAYFLATIQVLDKEEEEFAKIQAVIVEIARESVRPKNKFQALLKKLPVWLISTPIAPFLLRKFNEKVSKLAHPDGFQTEIITHKAETYGLGYGVNINECAICKLFDKYKLYKYAKILCEVDYITSSLAGLELIRTATIAQGAKSCDFRWRKG